MPAKYQESLSRSLEEGTTQTIRQHTIGSRCLHEQWIVIFSLPWTLKTICQVVVPKLVLYMQVYDGISHTERTYTTMEYEKPKRVCIYLKRL